MISVVIPLYNKAGTIQRAVSSAANGWPFVNEVIVVDDGSTDDSLTIVKMVKHPNVTIKVVSQVNRGVANARNKGTENAKNSLISFLDADDEHCENYASEMFKLSLVYPDAVAFTCNHVIQKGDGVSRVPSAYLNIPERLINLEDYYRSGCELVNSSKVTIRRSSLIMAGGFPDGAALCEDMFVWMMLFRHGQIAFSPLVLSRVYVEEDNSRHARDGQIPYPVKFFSEKEQIQDRWERRVVWRIHYKHLLGSLLSGKKREFLTRYEAGKKLFGFRQWPFILLLFCPTRVFEMVRVRRVL